MADIKISQLPVATVVNDADLVVLNQGGTTKTAARSLVNAPTGTLPVANGGTGVTVSSGANSVVLRDASQNITANSVIEGFSSITASGTQVVLTVASVPSYLVTGSGGQTIKLPDATTLQSGVVYLFNNNQSSGAISVNNNSNTLVASIPSGGFSAVSLLSNATAAGSWERHEQAPSNVSWSTNTLDYAGSITGATWNGNAVAVNRGGTGQSTFTDGQLLIGNSTGNTLTKAPLTGVDNIAITNGNGSISIGLTAGAYIEFFEHFLGTTPLDGNLVFGATGGTNTVVNSGFGVIAMATGATASANQNARLNQAGNTMLIGNSSSRSIFRVGQSGATWFDGTLTGAFRCGWGDSITGESANGMYFRVQNGQSIEFVTKSSNVETATVTGSSFSTNTFNSLEILINSTGTQVIARIDGSIVATHTTNIPSASRVIFFAHINRSAATATSVVANIDFVYSRVTPNTPFFN